MKLPFAHLSQTAVATLAAAIAISLSIVLLSGAGRQGQAVPLLPALGGAVNQVAAGLESPGHAGATQPRGTARAPVQVHAPVAFTPSVGATRPVKHPAHRVHRTRAPVVRRSTEAPAPKASAPVRSAPITTQRFSAAPKGVAKGKSHAPGQLKKAKGKSHAPGQLKAKWHGHGHAAKPVTAPRAQSHAHGKARGHHKAGGQSKAHGNAKAVGQGKARGHSGKHHQGPPPGQAKKAAPTAPPAAAPTHGNGNGNGGGNEPHGGGKK
jgi:hypothetical protein